MKEIENTYIWGGLEFHAPEGQEVFFVTDWHKGQLGKGKQHDPNQDFECVWRIVDTDRRFTGNSNVSSNGTSENATPTTENNGNFPEILENSEVSVTGSQATMGSPESALTPTPTDKLLSLPSLERARSDKSRLTIACDTEFFYIPVEKPAVKPVAEPVNGATKKTGKDNEPKKVPKELGPRCITSYQFALYLDDGVHVLEVVFIVKPTINSDGSAHYKRLTLSQCLGAILDLSSSCQEQVVDYRETRRWTLTIQKADGTTVDKSYKSPEEALNAVGTLQKTYDNCVVDTSNVSASIYNNAYSDYMGERAIKITLLSHFGSADLSAFAPERGGKSILKNLSAVQRGLVSTQEQFFRAPHRDYWKFYPCMVEFRDTMCYSAPGKKALEALGLALDIPKIVLPTGAIQKMDQFLKSNRDYYLSYSANDTLITLAYASRMWGVNKEMPITASSAAANVAYQAIRDYMGLNSRAEYQLAYGGLKKVVHGKNKIKDKPGYLEVSSLEPYDHRADLLLSAAANSYKGGFNGCTRVGWFEGEEFYDYDLQNAYPTSMCSVYDIDFQDGKDPLAYDPICKRELTLKDFPTPYTPLFAYISYEFPEGTKYPCIPISHEGSLIFPRTSNGFEGVYACGPDIYLALKMGAKVFCHDGYVGRIRTCLDNTPSQSLREAVYQFVQDRITARQIYGKGSIEELILKIMVNSIYGKTAQNVIQKHTWDGLHDEYKDLGMSIVTCPIHAAITTAGVRCVLIAAMTQLEELGYKVWSVTTDGFISNAQLDVLSGLDLYGFAKVFKASRLYLTNGKSDAMWEAKHTMNRFLNLATRANVSPDLGGVCAHGGLQTGFAPDTQEDRSDYISKSLKRTGSVPSPHMEFVNLKTMIKDKEDFHSYDCVTNINLDFDMKRKPLETSFRSVWVDVDGDYASSDTPVESWQEIACFDTVPFDTIAEYLLYRSIKESSPVLRTSEDWKRFFVKVHCPDNSKVRVADPSWSILMSCIIGYRLGKLPIEGLDQCKTLDEKLAYINSHNSTGKVFTQSHWKNARRPERASQMLPVELLTDTLAELRGENSFGNNL